MADIDQPLFFPQSLPIQSGDIIFREGTESISEFILSVDHGGYSHVGMLYQIQNKWYVIHATPSEKTNIPDSVVLDELSFYLSKNHAKRYAIYTVQADQQQYQQAAKYIHNQLGKPFDITGINGTYCTLLILEAWKTANVDLQVTFTEIDLPLIGGRYLLPKDLRASEKLTIAYKGIIQ